MDTHDVGDLSLTDSELDNHVRNALKAVGQGDYDDYNQLLAVIHHKERLSAEEVALLVTCLKAMTGAVSSINIVHHRSLLAAILSMSLWDYGTDVMDALVEFLVSLASSSGEYVDLCLDMLVVNFMPPVTLPSASFFLEFLKKPQGMAKKDHVLERVHSTLKDIANVVPLSPLRLGKIVRDKMPNIYMKELFLSMYVENMLRLECGVMGKLVGHTVLIALMDRLIDLDVELPWDEILQDDFSKGIFDMELECFEAQPDDAIQDCPELTKEALIQKYFCGNLVAEKLDSLMVLTFEHLQYCFKCDRLSQVFETLLQSFQKTILTAYKSKFAQFVLFYACSLDPDNCGKAFANVLLNIFTSSVNPEWRMSAVAYLASYLARAKFLSVSFVASILESVVNWCFIYCKDHESNINPRAHNVFYAGCQATMYILCFRMRQILSVPRLNSRLRLKRIEDILGHPLKPLQVCLPSVVEEFAELLRKNGVSPVHELFVGVVDSENSQAFGGVGRLDMFFPFDPCLLRKSDSYIRPNYVYWSMVRSSYDEDEGFDSEDVDFEEEIVKMSITPRDHPKNMFGGRLTEQNRMPPRIRPSTSP